MRALQVSFLVLATLLLAGCPGVSALNFTKADDTGVTDQKVFAAFVAPDELPDNLKAFIVADSDLLGRIKSACAKPQAPGQAVAPALVPILAAIGKLLFDLAADKAQRQLDELKKAAQQSYSGTVIYSGSEVRTHRCLLIARTVDTGDGTNKKAQLSFAALLRMSDYGSGFIIQPTLIEAKNAVAVTAKDTPQITTSIAVSVKSIIDSPLNGKTLVANGQAVVSVQKISVLGIPKDGKPAAQSKSMYKCPATEPTKAADFAECPRSDLIPYPNNGPYSVTVSVTETGEIGIDLDVASSEVKAIKEAIGPAISDAISTKFKKD